MEKMQGAAGLKLIRQSGNIKQITAISFFEKTNNKKDNPC